MTSWHTDNYPDTGGQRYRGAYPHHWYSMSSQLPAAMTSWHTDNYPDTGGSKLDIPTRDDFLNSNPVHCAGLLR